MSKRFALVWGFLALSLLLLGSKLGYHNQPLTSEQIIEAIKLGERNGVKRWLADGGDPNLADLYGDTALIWACFRNDAVMAENLLTHGADPNLVGGNDRTALHWTSEEGSLKLSELLVENGADVNQRDKWERTPLMYGVQSQNMNMVKYLLAQGGEANVSDSFGKSALLLAVDSNDPGMVELLVTAGADMDNPCEEKTPLQLAVERNKQHLFLTEKIRTLYPDIQNRMLAYQ